uniref:BSD domain-containing protein n=1 Tax=Lactuca sativa TaxID=4236 RepID=A0A9R1VEI4_LACSA|nr:hypothetical protein LSAT_V11C500237570 [Lactuca sativa]
MDFWQKARTFAEDAAKRSQELTKEAAKRSQELTKEAAKRSQEFTIGSSKLSDIVLEASKRSKEIAAEASKKVDFVKVEALKRADQIKSQIPSTSAAISQLVVDSSATAQPGGTSPADLEKFGITEELREFVKEITINTFRDFPLEVSNGEVQLWCTEKYEIYDVVYLPEDVDDSQISDIPTISNVRQDLTKWQEIHAKLVLSSVKPFVAPLLLQRIAEVVRRLQAFSLRKNKQHLSVLLEISKLRYDLCPRVMKERKFWRIYFLLVNTHLTPYEKRHIEEEEKKKCGEKVKEDDAATESVSSKTEEAEKQKTKTATSKTADQDLDVFLLGDLGDSDDGQDDKNDDGLDDDDFDKL